jgi:hypothetical protein
MKTKTHMNGLLSYKNINKVFSFPESNKSRPSLSLEEDVVPCVSD